MSLPGIKLQHLLLLLWLVMFSATSSAQVRVKVEISGIDKTMEDNVRLFLSIEQQKDHPLMSEGRLNRLNKKSVQEIARALQPFGYYRPQITSSLDHPEKDEWIASYRIDPGPALPIAVFDFTLSDEMQKDEEFQKLIKSPPLVTGKTFNHQQYEGFKSSLAKLASERGYFRARFIQHRVEIDLNAYAARVYLSYDGGPRFRYGAIHLQQDVLDPELLQRYVTFNTGEPYLVDDLIDLQHALDDSDYFQFVEVSPGELQPDSHEVPINVILKPRKRNRYGFGLGYGTDTGARTKFSWEIPRFNEQGHRFNSEAKISQTGYSLEAFYRIPILNPRSDEMVYSAGQVNEKTDTSDSTVSTIGASLKRSHAGWRETISLNYQQEDYIIADEPGSSYLLTPGINWNRTWGSNFINVLDGLRFNIGLRGARKDLFSDSDFVQLQGGIKAITSLPGRNRIISRGNLGSTWTSEFDQLPSSVRFFTGGAQSVRGYAYQSLGPLDDTDQVIGGKYLMVGSIEVEHSFNGKWGVALFYDAGNAIDSLDDELARGAGFGLRWKSPVGPVRIDLASALSEDGRPWRLHINIGPDL